MKQIILAATGFEIPSKRTHKREFLYEMNQIKRGNKRHFGMKVNISVDTDSRLVHTVIDTTANVNDVTLGHGTRNPELYEASVSKLIYLMGGMGKPIGIDK
jgi:IS5 family transposase